MLENNNNIFVDIFLYNIFSPTQMWNLRLVNKRGSEKSDGVKPNTGNETCWSVPWPVMDSESKEFRSYFVQ